MRLKIYLFTLVFLSIISCSEDEVVPEEIVNYVQSITINGSDITSGTTGQMTATVLPTNSNNKDVLWEVSDFTIAEISKEGLVTSKKNGTVIVTATAKDRGFVKSIKVVKITSFETINNIEVSNVDQLLEALKNVKAGETIVLANGTYNLTSRIDITKSGTSQNKISLIGKEGQGRPKFVFSSMPESSSNRGIQLNGSFWHIKGIDVFDAGDNGMFVSGNNNIIEFCTFSENSDTGLQIGNGGSNNTVLNCDSFFNADSTLENADGFASKLDAGTGNKFIGCRAWQNLDDGWDGYLRGNDNITTTYENCWAFKNGILKDGTVGAGDGNGFKTGGSDDKLLKHNAIYKNCLAVANTHDGFDHNSNRGDITIYNCSAYKNGKNISFGTGNIANSLTIKNTASLASISSDSFAATITDITNNSWQNGISIANDDFVSLDINLLSSPRNADGSLPSIDFMKLATGSDLIDAGVNVGLPFKGSAPDLGAFEY